MGAETGTDEILVVTSEEGVVRGGLTNRLKTEELARHITTFLHQMGRVLDEVPETAGAFRFTDFEVSAEVTAKGSLALLGSGGETGAKGGLKFVFRRTRTQSEAD
jgi:hypothetical protein